MTSFVKYNKYEFLTSVRLNKIFIFHKDVYFRISKEIRISKNASIKHENIFQTILIFLQNWNRISHSLTFILSKHFTFKKGIRYATVFILFSHVHMKKNLHWYNMYKPKDFVYILIIKCINFTVLIQFWIWNSIMKDKLITCILLRKWCAITSDENNPLPATNELLRSVLCKIK